MTSGVGDVVLDDGIGQSLYHYESVPVPSTGNGRRAWAEQQMADDPPAKPVATAPAPVVAPTPPPAKNGGGKMIVGLGLAAGALTAGGLYGLMRWRQCPEASDPKAIALTGVVGGLSAVLGAFAVKKLAS